MTVVESTEDASVTPSVSVPENIRLSPHRESSLPPPVVDPGSIRPGRSSNASRENRARSSRRGHGHRNRSSASRSRSRHRHSSQRHSRHNCRMYFKHKERNFAAALCSMITIVLLCTALEPDWIYLTVSKVVRMFIYCYIKEQVIYWLPHLSNCLSICLSIIGIMQKVRLKIKVHRKDQLAKHINRLVSQHGSSRVSHVLVSLLWKILEHLWPMEKRDVGKYYGSWKDQWLKRQRKTERYAGCTKVVPWMNIINIICQEHQRWRSVGRYGWLCHLKRHMKMMGASTVQGWSSEQNNLWTSPQCDDEQLNRTMHKFKSTVQWLSSE